MIFLLTLLFILMLVYPSIGLQYAKESLLLWFHTMVPTLFPFMILSGILIRQNMTERFASFLYPILRPVFKFSKNGCYCMILGFLCGFPMGARVIAELLEAKKICYEEASYLLCFCNNIGPVYYITFFLPTIAKNNISSLPIYLFGLYGIPILYAIIYRNSKLRKISFNEAYSSTNESEGIELSTSKSIDTAIRNITLLGAYMIFFSMLTLIPYALIGLLSVGINQNCLAYFRCLAEISTGIKQLGVYNPYFALMILPLGGLSCIAQTSAMLQNTDLKMKTYLFHKLIQTMLTMLYYFFIFFYDVSTSDL